MRALSSLPFCHCDGRRVSLWYLSAGRRYTTHGGRTHRTLLAYLLLIRACHQEILPGTSWSIAQLQHAFRLRIITNQVEHNVKTRLTKARKVA